MDNKLLKDTAHRLNIYDESVVKKSEEYLRLYQSKASLKSLNNQAKIILCLDLAAKSLGEGFDKETALTLSGFKKSTYQKSLNTLENILGLAQTVTIADICVQLGSTDIKEDAEDILERYKKLDNKIKDLEHPQYVAVSTYLACKAKKISVDKTKIISISRLKPSQWKELVTTFEKLGLGQNCAGRAKKGTVDNDEVMIETDDQEVCKKDDVEEVEEYEVWKKRILKEAQDALKEEFVKMEN